MFPTGAAQRQFHSDSPPVATSTGITEADPERTPFLFVFFFKYLINRKKKLDMKHVWGGHRGVAGEEQKRFSFHWLFLAEISWRIWSLRRAFDWL